MASKKVGNAIRDILGRYAGLGPSEKTYAHSEDYRSDSENGRYANAVMNALRDQRSFDNFKRARDYQRILEHVSFEQGQDYLDILRRRNDGILEQGLKTVLVSDGVGNPAKHEYEGIDIPLSPTTLRYLKVASDLRGLFGNDLGRVAEIGCGYGGQCYVNDQLLNVELATLFDLPFVNQLIERYLNVHLLNGAYRTIVINQAESCDYDLVVSNYAFSELPAKLQMAYIRKVVAKSTKGYLTMNTGLGGPGSDGKLLLSELRAHLPEFEVYEEEPLTGAANYIIVWGHNKAFADKFLTPKDV
jgi:putative sugar O-methyltransferase